MMRASLIPVLICLAALSAGCDSNTIFSDNFNADTVGIPPNLDPPGNPVGDQIYLPAASEGTYPSPAIVVNATGFSSNALRYSNNDIPYIWRYLGLLSADADPTTTDYLASWNGRLSLVSNSSALDVWFGDSHFGEIASIRFDGGHVYLKTAISPPAYEDLGTVTYNANHTVWFNIDKENATYSFSLFQDSGDNRESGRRSVLNRDSLDTQNPTVYFWFSEEGVSSSGTYTVDDVTITESQPSSAGDVDRLEAFAPR